MKRLTAFLLVIMLFSGVCASAQTATLAPTPTAIPKPTPSPTPTPDLKQTTESMRTFFYNHDTLCGYIDVPGRGEMYYYAQNDPSWKTMRYNNINEMKRSYSIGGAGCCPTAFAMLLRAVVPVETLLGLNDFSYQGAGYPFCICSNMPKFCSGVHERFLPETTEEFAHFLPIILSAYLGGNNAGRQIGNSLTRTILTRLNIPYKSTQKADVALEALKNGAVIFSNTGTDMSPFTRTGHYIVLASYDNGYIYVLDSYYRDSYEKFDRQNVLEIVQPGLVRAKEEDMKKLRISGYLIVYPQEGEDSNALSEGND